MKKIILSKFVFLFIFIISNSCNNFDPTEVLKGTIFDNLQESYWQPIIIPLCNSCLIKNDIGFDFTAGNNQLEKFLFNYKIPQNDNINMEPELDDENKILDCHIREFFIIENPISLKNDEIIFTIKEKIIKQNRPIELDWKTSIKLLDISTLEISHTRNEEDSTGTLITFTRINRFKRVSLPKENKTACD